jgi:hydrogenase maturation protease
MTRPLLVAGIGNMFLGDDAFGCEVVKRLCALYPQRNEAAELRDFGINTRALGYVLAERTSGTTVIVDALATGGPPGTVQLLDLAAPELPTSTRLSHHALGLDDALTLAIALGACLDHTYLLGCEPASFEPSHAVGRLTPAVEVAARRCVELLCRLIEQPGEDLVGLCRTERQTSKTP